MAASDDLDDFFKKKDRKGNKNKKQPALLTNNEELLKQLVIVTSATSAFKENMDFDEEDEEGLPGHQHMDQSNGISTTIDDGQSKPPSSSTNKIKPTSKLSVQDNNNNLNDQPAGDEWEEFEDSKSKFDQLRLRFARTNNDNENEDEHSDDENHQQSNFDENTNHLEGDDGEQSSRTNRRREQQKDKPVWKFEQVQPATNNEIPVEKTEEPPATVAAKPVTTGAYRPPQLRGNSSVTIVSSVNQRVTKKEKPNIASNEEFPTLGAAVNKK